MARDAARAFAIGLLAAAALACAHSYQVDSDLGDHPEVRLGADATIYVAKPLDGAFETRLYPGSGAMTAVAIYSALSPYADGVRLAGAHASRESDLAAARAEDFAYLLSSTILHWEERATEWSGRPDRISVRLELVDVASGEVVDRATITGRSRWATFGGDHPQDLLSEPLDSYSRALFAVDAGP